MNLVEEALYYHKMGIELSQKSDKRTKSDKEIWDINWDLRIEDIIEDIQYNIQIVDYNYVKKMLNVAYLKFYEINGNHKISIIHSLITICNLLIDDFPNDTYYVEIRNKFANLQSEILDIEIGMLNQDIIRNIIEYL
jgi:hypothetical protein